MEINFGEIIKQIREERGFTLKEAAGTAISPNNLSKFEKGITTIKVDTYFKILENLKIYDANDMTMLMMRYQYQDPKFPEFEKTRFTTPTKVVELSKALGFDTYFSDLFYIQSLEIPRKKENLTKEDWTILNRTKNTLFHLNYWLAQDYSVFNALIHYFDFPTETLQQIAKTALALLKETFVDFIQKRMLLSTLLTIIRTYSRNGHYQLAQNLVDKIDVYRIKELHSLKGVLQEAFIQIKMQECYNLLRQDKKEGIELASQILAYLDSLNGLFLDQTISQLRDIFYQQVKMLNKTGIDWS
ncbi:helix-turn-helix domain-containing protein [Streptococcus mitis]|uniref:helix-turn-helix domain-containing protein n=1 Tax=Streptococcus mitis TaxID=28037 RepID=UPI00200076B7|nr:helix-turn-helix transcriptional regulator [Streptococcus mitis]